MIDFVPKTIQLLLESLKRIANGVSTPQWVSLITNGRYDERSTGTLQLLFRYIKSCFMAEENTSSFYGLWSYLSNWNSHNPENSILPWPFTLFKRAEAVFFPSFTTLCLALLPTAIAMVGIWNKRRQRIIPDVKPSIKNTDLHTEEKDKIISHTNQEERLYKADIQCTQPTTAVPVPAVSASPTVLQPVTAIPAPIVSASPSVLQLVTANPAPIVSASQSVPQPVTAIPAPIVSASPSVLQLVTANPAPIGPASPSILRATSLGNDCTCKNKEKPGPPQVKFIKHLGQGNQAFIHKVQLGNSIFAAKISFPDTPVKDILNEFEILRHLSHKNIIAVHQALPKGFIMELCQTDLFSVIKTHGRLPPGVIHVTGSDIINGVSYLHSKGIAHLDIKPRNILLTKHAVAKIADFGLALPIQNDDGSIRTLEHEFRGSFYYAPPDMFIQSCPIELASCDSWSTGATLFFIMTGNIPFEGETELELVQNQISENFNIPESLTNTINNSPFYNLFMKLIKGLCTRDTRERFSIDKAKDFYGKLKL